MRGRLAAALLAGALLLGGCRASVKTGYFAVQTSPEANDRSPVPVAVVVVYDAALLKTVAALTAHDWFARRAQLTRDHPTGFQAVSWEFVPGQTVPLQPLRLRRKKARGAFVFADYAAPGDHRVRVDPYRRVVIRLLDADVAVEPLRR
ncbi:MAG: hypothetical protein JO040_08385 [Gemmatimonadetes bacterium]|nr:hypothetical protein [Gemmatimonadota bacterium]